MFICSGDASGWLRVTWLDVYLSNSQSIISSCSSKPRLRREKSEWTMRDSREAAEVSAWQFWSVCWFWQTWTCTHCFRRRWRWRCWAVTSYLNSVFSVCSLSFVSPLLPLASNFISKTESAICFLLNISFCSSHKLTRLYHKTTTMTSLHLVVDVDSDSVCNVVASDVNPWKRDAASQRVSPHSKHLNYYWFKIYTFWGNV